MTPEELIRRLLFLDLKYNADKLGFIEDFTFSVSETFLIECIGALDELSRLNTERSQKMLIALSSLIWTYRRPEWDGLKDYLILFLSRAGFGPSSIMVDKDYDSDTQKYSNSFSLVNNLAVTLNQIQYEVHISKKSFLLTQFQRKIWDEIDLNKLMGISAPTSAGKSFVILLKCIDLLLKKHGTVIYIVPTLSLVSQVAADFKKILTDFQLDQYDIKTTFSNQEQSETTIYVLTQEKAISSFSQSKTPFQAVRILVIDEIQNVERVADADDQRAKVLYDLMMELREKTKLDHIIISGPRIENIDRLGFSIFGINAVKNETNSSPVMSLTYSIIQKKKEYFLTLHSDVLDGPIQTKITNPEKIRGYGQSLYTEPFLDYLKHLVEGLGQENNIIFSPTAKASRQIAEKISSVYDKTDSPYLLEMSAFLAESVHPNFSLCNTIKNGIAYHHGKMPTNARILVEDAIRKNYIKNIVCTTTLLQGVNLPVQNIIVRNPNLFVKAMGGKSPKLSNYEMSNLRGRAGRLLKDFIGRTFVLDETSFEVVKEDNQMNLFGSPTKEIKVGYREKFNDHKSEIKNDLINTIGNNPINKGYSYLNTYIRQSILKNGSQSGILLARVGIELSQSEINDIYQSLSVLDISAEICGMNRYWDPVDLAFLKKEADNISLPTSVSDASISYQLKRIIAFYKRNLPVYADRHFNVAEIEGSDILLTKCILAENWLKEHSLKRILDTAYYTDSERIELAIADLQNKISFGLPMLIKPLYDIKHPGSMFPRFLEMGAYHPITRRMIELNIPRETAIHIRQNYDIRDDTGVKELITELKKIKPLLSYWHQIQLNLI